MGNENACCAPQADGNEGKNMKVEDLIQRRQMVRMNGRPDSMTNAFEQEAKPEKIIPDTKVSTQPTERGDVSGRDRNAVDKAVVVPPINLAESRQSQHGEALVEKPITTLTDGSKYKGQWRGEKKEGKGMLEYTDGAIYTGRAKNNDEANLKMILLKEMVK